MPLIRVIRHGFEFWEAPHCMNPPLPELPKSKSRLADIAAGQTEYRRRLTPAEVEASLSVVPSIPPDIANIQQMVIQAFNLTHEEFYGRSRVPRVANARLASMALCRAYTLRTVEEIGEAHHRHHRVVCHASWRFAELQQADPWFAAAIARIESTLLEKAA